MRIAKQMSAVALTALIAGCVTAPPPPPGEFVTFAGEKLENIAARFNERNAVKIIVEDNAKEEPFAGAVYIDRPERLAAIIATNHEFHVEHRGDAYYIGLYPPRAAVDGEAQSR